MVVLWCFAGRSIFVGRSCRLDIFVFRLWDHILRRLHRRFSFEPILFTHCDIKNYVHWIPATRNPLDSLTLCLHLCHARSWPRPCGSTRASQFLTSTATLLAMRESRPGGRSGRSLEDHRNHGNPMDLITVSGSTICSRDGFGTWSRHESRSYNM